MYADEWPEVGNLVQSVLNNSLSTRLNKGTPMQVITGHAEKIPLELMLKDNVPVDAPLDFIKAQKLMKVEKLSKIMTEIHAQVSEKATRDCKNAIQKHNDKMHMRSPKFQVGDYVLVVEYSKSGTSKLQVKWKGPRSVASVGSDDVFVVENLLTKELKAAHATRLRLCKDKELNVTAELAQAAEHNDHQFYVVSKILDACCNEQEIFHELLVASAVSPLERPSGNLTQLWLWMFRRWWRRSRSLTTIQTWCARCEILESSHGRVFCAAKDENSVDIICKRFSCNFLRKSRIRQFRLAQRLTQDVATLYER
jgi:hypothetical protein